MTRAVADGKPFSITLARKPGGAPDVSSSTSTTNTTVPSQKDGAVSEDMAAAESFWRKLTGKDGECRFTQGDLVAVAVPSSEGWEDRDDIHWFYGFTTKSTSDNDNHTSTSSLYVRFPTTAGWDAKDLNGSLLALIELGQEVCMVGHVWLVVKRNPDELENLVHTLMYVGFEVDDPSDLTVSEDDYLLLRLDL